MLILSIIFLYAGCCRVNDCSVVHKVRKTMNFCPSKRIFNRSTDFQVCTNFQSKHFKGDSNSLSNSLRQWSHCLFTRLQPTSQRLGAVAASLNFLRDNNVQFPTKLSAGYCRHCAKPPVRCWCFYSFIFTFFLFHSFFYFIGSRRCIRLFFAYNTTPNWKQ